MNKMLVWFHSFPEEPEDIVEDLLFAQIHLSAFQIIRSGHENRRLFSGNFNEFIDFIETSKSMHDVELVLPSSEILYSQVSVPSKSRNRIMQALPFLLEDSLNNTIEQYYFALGEVQEGQCQVAIMSRFMIETIFSQLKKMALPVSIMTSELFQIPWQPNTWSISLLNNELLIRTGLQNGLSISANNIDFMFQLLLKSSADPEESQKNESAIEVLPEDFNEEVEEITAKSDEHSQNEFITQKPERIIIYAQKNSDLTEKIKSIAQNFAIETEQVNKNLLSLALSDEKLKSQYRTKGQWGINLLQGEFHPGTLQQRRIPFLKSLIVLSILFLGSQLFLMNYQWQQSQEKLTTLQTELQQLYFKSFPGAKKLIDVRSQTENKLKKLQKNSSSKETFLSLLALVGDELRQIKGLKILVIRYNDGILQLEIRTKGFIFNQIKSTMQQKQGILVEEKSSSKVKTEVHSVLSFRIANS